MVQLVARKLGLMSHDLLKGGEKNNKFYEFIQKISSIRFFLLLWLQEIEQHGDQKFQKTD
jgi:hypothetical protein